ncbi:hypothetical protein [Bacteriovorax sp. Seq25_V]|uniref:hypothetical protein n=1 Tax=Bacteriovorax sp. Seq25_V TaxID=1201288 RepID=UPI000389DF8A|nr:hypothetical protein [Bacteriovorax sp. Seq25_V]EQC47350.1 hypothetical protein M900_0763 [Bacteriovorax sp. Seq25_V]
MKYIILALLLLAGCATPEEQKFVRVDVDSYYRQNGVVKYFLGVLPRWSNTSSAANCTREHSVNYFDFNSVGQSFSLNYEQIAAFQYLYDSEYSQAIAKSAGRALTLKEEESLFFASLDKIKSGQRLFKVPSFNTVNVIWVDDFKSTDKLGELLSSSILNSGRPVLLSMCKTRSELREYFRKEKINIEGMRILTFESFSYFSSDLVLQARESIDLNKVLGNKKVNFYTSRSKVPENIQGKVTLRIYK